MFPSFSRVRHIIYASPNLLRLEAPESESARLWFPAGAGGRLPFSGDILGEIGMFRPSLLAEAACLMGFVAAPASTSAAKSYLLSFDSSHLAWPAA